jgi:hypothetical protein
MNTTPRSPSPRIPRLESRESLRSMIEPWIGLGLCAGVVLGWMCEQLLPNPDGPQTFAPDWLPLVAAGVAAAGIQRLDGSLRWLRVQGALRWVRVLLLVWAANGLPFDLLTAAGLIGHRTANGAIVLSSVYWPGLATRSLALAAAIVLARGALALPIGRPSARAGTWFGYAAFLLALPYPVLRLHWALGGTVGLLWPGAAGQGWEPLLIAIPWVLAAVLSLLLVSPRPWLPRRVLLAAGWSATLIVAMIGPSALWALIRALASGGTGIVGIEAWVVTLFYGSWFLFAIAAAAATRSYQVHSLGLRLPSPAGSQT